MNKPQNEFLNGLKYVEGETSQRKVAEEAIKKQLFSMLIDLNLKNGEATDLNEMVEQIANNLGLQAEKNQIAQYVTKVLRTGNYQFDIDDNGNIRANYSRLYLLQEISAEKERKEVNGILQGFIEKTKLYASELEQQNVRVTATNLRNKFSPREQEFKDNWIAIAIDKVLEMQSLEK